MKKLFLLCLSALMFTGIATVGRCDAEKNEDKFEKRYAEQAARIEKGLNEGQINPKEKERLLAKFEAIKADHDQNVAKHGHITDKMAEELNKRQNELSEEIKKARTDNR